MGLPELSMSQWPLADSPGQVLVAWPNYIDSSCAELSAATPWWWWEGVTAHVRKEHRENWRPRGSAQAELSLSWKKQKLCLYRALVTLRRGSGGGGGQRREEKNHKNVEQRKACPWENSRKFLMWYQGTWEHMKDGKGGHAKMATELKPFFFCSIPPPSLLIGDRVHRKAGRRAGT